MAETYLRYQPKRDVLFVLGAGASQPDGVPLQRELLPMIISGEVPQIGNSEIGKVITEFIDDNFVCDVEKGEYPQLEAVFGFLDYFIQANESLSAKYTNALIREIKEYLIKVIHYVVDIKTEQESNFYKEFWTSIDKYNRNISILTLNYDTLLEQAFRFLYKSRGYIDYAIHLMNYDKESGMENFNRWINPREPIVIDDEDDPVPIKIIKLHGSLNWKYCNCCNQTLLTPWDRKIDLNRGKLLGYTYPERKEYEYECPLDNTEFETLIMPPSFVKALNQPVISQLLSEAGREIRISKKIVFVGYSLSSADVHIKALFKKQLKEETSVTVVSPRQTDGLRLKYRSLNKNANFIQLKFEDLVKNESLMKEILTT